MSGAPHDAAAAAAAHGTSADALERAAEWVVSEDTPRAQPGQQEYFAATVASMLEGAEIAGLPRTIAPSLATSATPSARTLVALDLGQSGAVAAIAAATQGALRKPAAAPTADEILALPIGSLKPNEIQRIVRITPEELRATYDSDSDAAIANVPMRDAFINLLKKHALSAQQQDELRRIMRCGVGIHHATLVSVHACKREDLEFTTTPEAETPEIVPGTVVPKPGTLTWHIMTWITRDELIPCRLVRLPGETAPSSGGVASAVASKLTGGPARSPPRYELIADMRQFADGVSDVAEGALWRARALERELAQAHAATAARDADIALMRDEIAKREHKIRDLMKHYDALDTAHKASLAANTALEHRIQILGGSIEFLREAEAERTEMLRDLLLQRTAPSGIDALPSRIPAPPQPVVAPAADAAAESTASLGAAMASVRAEAEAHNEAAAAAAAAPNTGRYSGVDKVFTIKPATV